MSEPLILSGSDHVAEIPRVPLFAVPVRKPNPAYIAVTPDEGDRPEGDRPEGYDPETPEFITELVQYDMPTEVNPVLGLEYGERSSTNSISANVWIIKEVVGEKAYRALVNELKRMSPKDSAAALTTITEKIVAVALGN